MSTELVWCFRGDGKGCVRSEEQTHPLLRPLRSGTPGADPRRRTQIFGRIRAGQPLRRRKKCARAFARANAIEDPHGVDEGRTLTSPDEIWATGRPQHVKLGPGRVEQSVATHHATHHAAKHGAAAHDSKYTLRPSRRTAARPLCLSRSAHGALGEGRGGREKKGKERRGKKRKGHPRRYRATRARRRIGAASAPPERCPELWRVGHATLTIQNGRMPSRSCATWPESSVTNRACGPQSLARNLKTSAQSGWRLDGGLHSAAAAN